MGIQERFASLGQNREEVLEKAVQCKTAEELIQLGKDNKIALSEQEAVELLGLLNRKRMELSDSALDVAAGGWWWEPSYQCRHCGSMNTSWKDPYALICHDCGKTF